MRVHSDDRTLFRTQAGLTIDLHSMQLNQNPMAIDIFFLPSIWLLCSLFFAGVPLFRESTTYTTPALSSLPPRLCHVQTIQYTCNKQENGYLLAESKYITCNPRKHSTICKQMTDEEFHDTHLSYVVYQDVLHPNYLTIVNHSVRCI